MKANYSRLHETSMNKNGHMMEIIEYRSCKNITVKFDTGFVKERVYYSDFKAGTVKHPGIMSPEHEAAINNARARRIAQSREKHMGETAYSNNGQMMTIIGYENTLNVTVQFEDGTIVHNRPYAYFKKGIIANPNCRRSEIHKKKLVESRIKHMQEKRIGETHKATNGMTLKITGYRNYNDIDVIFVEDGYSVLHTSYDVFQTGQIKNPNLCTQNHRNRHLHEKFITNKGEEIEIIDWRRISDVTVRFKDGSTKHTDYRSIQNGNVAKPGDRIAMKDIATRIGETSIAGCGQIMTIIAAKSSTDIDVQFENGDIVKHTEYESFRTGKVRIPHRIINNIKYSRTKTLFCGIPHWKCKCQKCGFEDYMTIEQMKQHQCDDTTDFINTIVTE